jgi:signal transduction histidine kinase
MKFKKSINSHGIGLGLTICYKIVIALGGKIKIAIKFFYLG